ncbi:MAG: energy transducer TonB, partial [Acidobacteriota bacterium]
AVISGEGKVVSLRVVNEPDPQLAKAALDAVKLWRYRPTLLNGEPVEVISTIEVTFRLEK